MIEDMPFYCVSS